MKDIKIKEIELKGRKKMKRKDGVKEEKKLRETGVKNRVKE